MISYWHGDYMGYASTDPYKLSGQQQRLTQLIIYTLDRHSRPSFVREEIREHMYFLIKVFVIYEPVI